MAGNRVPHELVTSVAWHRPDGDRAEWHMSCPDCDLRVSFTISPSISAHHFARALTAAHLRQMEAPDGDA